MKFEAINDECTMLVEIAELPQSYFEEIELATNDGSNFTIPGLFLWNFIKTTTDMTEMIGTRKEFTLTSPEWQINHCRVCKDRSSIYYRYAVRIT